MIDLNTSQSYIYLSSMRYNRAYTLMKRKQLKFFTIFETYFNLFLLCCWGWYSGVNLKMYNCMKQLYCIVVTKECAILALVTIFLFIVCPDIMSQHTIFSIFSKVVTGIMKRRFQNVTRKDKGCFVAYSDFVLAFY